MIQRRLPARYGVAGALALGLLFPAPSTPQASDLNRVAVSSIAPDFELPSASGAPARLSGWRGKNVVLVFYRGYW